MAYSPAELQDELARRTGRRILLFLNNNRRRMVSARPRGSDGIEVRLQKIFLDADGIVLGELADIITGGKGSRQALRRFVDHALKNVPDSIPGRRRQDISPEREKSANHNLSAYRALLNDTYLGGRSTALVVWGRRNPPRSKRSVRFACYDPERNMIIVNRKLDSPHIPAYFVDYILFHEMLHEVLGIGARRDGRRDIHGSLFKLMESTFPDFDKARRFEQELCRSLGKLG